ncbi:AAA-like domain-containing protein [Halogranum rubrum]|uniref:AAA-like domain-containing protein n=1 Tax=Halogranum rubrum TaxID=553466 RepID=A0A1I4FV90_9EURY|nr:DUF87 domain-containing protein [Halogranum rubrum]SFL21788.1 AAA-like domain-containing protein [Halogranum rubrum]
MSMDTGGNDTPPPGEERTLTISQDGTSLPVVEVLTGRGFITGKSGAGKSNSASVIAEELLEQGFPLLIVDVDGEYYGLKEQYEMLHVGADEECDLQVSEEHAAKIAELALDENVPIILDVSGYLDSSVAENLIRGVAQRLFALEKKRKKPFLMLVEEIHEYIPEGGGLNECGQMLIKVAKRGRKHGLGLCGLSQRPADVKKDFITQCDWLVWHRLTWDNDTAAVRRVLGSDYADTVQELDDGEAFLMTDWNDFIKRVQFKRKSTFDAGATPGLNDIERPNLKSVSGDIVDELEAISKREQKRRDRVAQLEQKLEQRDDQIEELRSELEQAQDVTKLADQFSEALAQVDTSTGGDVKATLEELREEKNETIRKLRTENERLRSKNKELEERISTLNEEVEASYQFKQFEANVNEATEAYQRLGDALGIEPNADNAERLRERIDELESELAATRASNYDADQPSEEIQTYREFISNDAVRDAIEIAKESASSPRYVDGTIGCIIEHGEPVTYEDIADHLNISTTSHVGSAVNALAAEDVVKKETRSSRTYVDLAIDDISEIRKRSRRREEAEELVGV